MCNILPEDGSTEANLIEFLENTSKGNILKRVQKSLVQPHLCVIVLACDVDELEEKQPASELITLGEWLDERGIELEHADKHRLANQVSKMYKKVYGEAPRTIARKDAQGYYRKKAYGFSAEELQILEQALTQVTHSTKPK